MFFTANGFPFELQFQYVPLLRVPITSVLWGITALRFLTYLRPCRASSTPNSIQVKEEECHVSYEKYRSTDNPLKRMQFWEEMVSLWDMVSAHLQRIL